MVVLVSQSGTITPLVSAGQTQLGVTEVGANTFLLEADLGALEWGDRMLIEGFTKILAGSTPKRVFNQVVVGGQLADPIWQSVPIPCDATAGHVSFYLTALSGSGRSIDWKILTL